LEEFQKPEKKPQMRIGKGKKFIGKFLSLGKIIFKNLPMILALSRISRKND